MLNLEGAENNDPAAGPGSKPTPACFRVFQPTRAGWGLIGYAIGSWRFFACKLVGSLPAGGQQDHSYGWCGSGLMRLHTWRLSSGSAWHHDVSNADRVKFPRDAALLSGFAGFRSLRTPASCGSACGCSGLVFGDQDAFHDGISFKVSLSFDDDEPSAGQRSAA